MWPLAALEAGLSQSRPLLICTCRDEFKLLTIGDPQGTTLTEPELLNRMAVYLNAEDSTAALCVHTNLPLLSSSDVCSQSVSIGIGSFLTERLRLRSLQSAVYKGPGGSGPED